MKQVSIVLLSIAATCAFAGAIPAAAAGNAGDLNAEREQAQLHPMMPNQAPEWSPYGLPMGEVYGPAVSTYTPTIYGYGVTYPAPIAQCTLAQDWTGQAVAVCP